MTEEPKSAEVLAPLRAIEIVPISHQGRQVLLLRDPTGIAAEPLLISPASLKLLPFFDGRHTLRDIQLAAARDTGQIIPSAQIDAFVAKLEANHLLDSPGYQAFRTRLAEEYAGWPSRPAQFAGRAYAPDARALSEQLSSFYRLPGAPGLPPAPVAQAPAGIAAPHIDPLRGGKVYAHAYAQLWGAPVRAAVLLGVSHAGSVQPFVMTGKDYATPLGNLRTDREALAALTRRIDWDPCAEEDLHRWEHSIEFQLIFLQHALACGREEPRDGTVKILPILCSFSWEDLIPAEEDSRRERIDAFLAGLAAVLQEAGHPWLLIAGVDLAHVGPRFGDEEPLSARLLAETHRRDQATLASLAAGDREGFVAQLAREGNDRRICGLPALYALATLLGGSRGRLLAYDQSVEPAVGSLVSFGALVFQGGTGPAAGEAEG